MPIEEVPGWVQLLAGLVGGALGGKIIDAARARGAALSKERLQAGQLEDKGAYRNVAERASLRKFEDELRKSILEENAGLRADIDNARRRIEKLEGDLEDRERACDERNRALTSEVAALRAENAAMTKEIQALSKKVASKHADPETPLLLSLPKTR